MRMLITGGAGFIGHTVVEHFRCMGDELTLLDRLDESGNLNRLAEIGAAKDPTVRFIYHDLRAPMNAQVMRQIGEHDIILHLAAGTHVDRSIEDPMAFVYDNVVGTCTMLEFARRVGCRKFVQFGTDEVFGPAPPGHAYKEDDRYRSANPYAATKAGAEELAMAYHNTYGVPVIATHTMNVIGKRQHPEKFVPMTIGKVMRGETVTIHADAARTTPGSRFYIDSRCVARALHLLIDRGVVGEKYNIVGAKEVSNLDMAQMIAESAGQPLRYELVDFHSSRPGHDLRYALDGTKMQKLGFSPDPVGSAVDRLVQWTLQNDRWLDQPLPRSAA